MGKKTQAMGFNETPSQLAQEMEGLAELVELQISSGLDRGDIVPAMYRSWRARLLAISKCSAMDKAMLTKALKTGPWDPEQLKDLVHILAVGEDDPEDSKPNRTRNQKCIHFENMLPMDKWIKLKDTVKHSLLSRVSIMAGIGHALGITNPDQPTLYRMVSILAYCEGNYDMSQKDVHVTMDKIQTFLKAQPRPDGIPYLEFYPPSAMLLPKSIRDKVYKEGDEPVDVDIPELKIILGETKMRGRKKSSCPEWLQHVPEEYRKQVMHAIGLGGSPIKAASSGSQSSDTSMPSPSLKVTDSDVLPIADVLRYRIKKKSNDKPEILPAPSTPQVADLDQETPNFATPESIDDLEQALVDAVEGDIKATRRRKTIKKPAAMKTTPTSPVIKKPAASGEPDMTMLWGDLRAEKSKLTLKKFTSKAYHYAQTAMLRIGHNRDSAKKFARSQYRKAATLYYDDNFYI